MKANSLEQVIKEYNPFGFKEENGRIKIFHDYGKVYLYALKKLYESFPKGYIDVPLFMHEQIGMPLSVCVMTVKKFPYIKTINEGIYFCEPVDGIWPKEKIEHLMKALHTISQTNFAQGYFNVAWDEFTLQLKNQESVN